MKTLLINTSPRFPNLVSFVCWVVKVQALLKLSGRRHTTFHDDRFYVLHYCSPIMQLVEALLCGLWITEYGSKHFEIYQTSSSESKQSCLIFKTNPFPLCHCDCFCCNTCPTNPWAAHPWGSRTLTHAADPLCDQVLQQGFQHGAVSGVQLVAVDPDVEAQPVGVGLCCHLCGRRELFLFLVAILVVPGKQERMTADRKCPFFTGLSNKDRYR